jgi:hypothetical protein
VRWGGSAGVVTGSVRPASGGPCVADPRPPAGSHTSKYRVTRLDESAGAVIGASTTGQGAFALADPRPAGLQNESRNGHSYDSQAHYGVLRWQDTSLAVPGFAKHDRGKWSVADPRPAEGEPAEALPKPNDRLVAVIQAEDGTWHRPFTTLELAALQSLVDPEEYLELDGLSDSDWRERIGNAVPPAAAAAIASVMGRTLLLAWSGQTFMLSSEPIWVQPIAVALSVAPSLPAE